LKNENNIDKRRKKNRNSFSKFAACGNLKKIEEGHFGVFGHK
jgi:hypothetical protein